jgi:hypothetical protein
MYLKDHMECALELWVKKRLVNLDLSKYSDQADNKIEISCLR